MVLLEWLREFSAFASNLDHFLKVLSIFVGLVGVVVAIVNWRINRAILIKGDVKISIHRPIGNRSYGIFGVLSFWRDYFRYSEIIKPTPSSRRSFPRETAIGDFGDSDFGFGFLRIDGDRIYAKDISHPEESPLHDFRYRRRIHKIVSIYELAQRSSYFFYGGLVISLLYLTWRLFW